MMWHIVANMRTNPTGQNGALHFRLNEKQKDKLTEIAEKHSLKPSDIARIAIEAFLNQVEAQGGFLFKFNLGSMGHEDPISRSILGHKSSRVVNSNSRGVYTNATAKKI